MNMLGAQITGKVSTHLNLNARQQYALKILHSPTALLDTLVAQKTEENPFLIALEDSEDEKILNDNRTELSFEEARYYNQNRSTVLDPETQRNFIENVSSQNQMSLEEHLQALWVNSTVHSDELAKKLGLYIISNLDEQGYFTESFDEIAAEFNVDPKTVEETLYSIQTLDPKGYGARDLKECLKIQARELNSSLAPLLIKMIDFHLTDIAHKNFNKIAQAQEVSLGEVLKAKELLQHLDPKPGRFFRKEPLEGAQPDFYVKVDQVKKTLSIVQNDFSRLNNLKFDQSLIGNQKKDLFASNPLIKEKVIEAKNLVQAIQHRNSTLKRLVELICNEQKDFFFEGPKKLKPMLMKDAAKKIECHESTISRACHKKYLSTRWGVFELSYFFSPTLGTYKGKERPSTGDDGCCVNALKEMVRDIIMKEDKARPFSDEQISKIMSQQGHKLARRTVSKYRESLGILPTKLRKEV